MLVADDSALLRERLREALLTMGHQCLVAADGDEALRQVQQAGVDVLIAGLRPDGLNGLDLSRHVREHSDTPYTYVMLMAEGPVGLDALAGGADDYLADPLSGQELRARMLAAERVVALHQKLDAQGRELEQANRQLFSLTRTDALTGLGNRLQMTEVLATLHARAERYDHSYAIALCDLDRFKAFNDLRGHEAGDEMLKRVAEILTQTTRNTDSVYRYGGEELLIALPEQTLASAELAGERLRRAVAGAALDHPANRPHGLVTVSVGIAAFDQSTGNTYEALIAEAEGALYDAKAAGRNRVAIARSPVSA
ncbi:MAG: diguanylate cyclase [Chloroflexi bacterium]|nr:diguanylate cyclase [Chloroflexota bacterium]